MNADTITTSRILDLRTMLEAATIRVGALASESAEGSVTVEDAAAEINEIIANINAANQ